MRRILIIRVSKALFLISVMLIQSFNPAFSFERTIHFWIKSFIPSKSASKSVALQLTDSGGTVIPVPYAPIPTSVPYPQRLNINECFSTDDRDFSANPTASARVTTEFLIKINGRNMRVESVPGRDIARYDPTHHVNCKTGEIILSLTANKTVHVGEVKEDKFARVLYVSASVGDPFYVNAPKVDYKISFRYDILARKITIEGSTGVFPAFEAYIEYDGETKTVLRRMPDPNSTAYSLFDLNMGINTNNFKHVINLK